MACPVCNQRKARRECPALHQTICTVCCATKRMVEINCPPDCPHLAAAREHPAAAVKRQQERSLARATSRSERKDAEKMRDRLQCGIDTLCSALMLLQR